jgi:ribosome-binding protein aMBF1 (putative translation factor)
MMALTADSSIGTAHGAGIEKRARKSRAYRAALEEQQPYEQLARLVIRRRMQLGITQQELADRMGTSRSVVAQLEDGQPASRLFRA